MRRVAVVGTFRDADTAAQLAAGFVEHGWDTVHWPEARPETWAPVADTFAEVDLVVWSRNRDMWLRFDQPAWLAAARRAGVPVVGFHLDRWWGLDREERVATDPFFRCDLVFSTDGGHDDRWLQAGVNHRWLPPAVPVAVTGLRGHECREASQRVVFVGRWQTYPHRQWPERLRLIRALQQRYGPRFACFPKSNSRRLWGQPLADVVQAAAVVVGDSCLAGGVTRYWSDRIPIVVGHGGFLLHPHVEGLDLHFAVGEHVVTYPVGDHEAVFALVERAWDDPCWGRQVAAAGRAHVTTHHTWGVRARQIVDACNDAGLLTGVV